MTRAFSDDLRSRVLAASRNGMSARSAAARFGIGISTAIAWIASARQGRLTPAKQGRRGGSRLDAHEDFIIGQIVTLFEPQECENYFKSCGYDPE